MSTATITKTSEAAFVYIINATPPTRLPIELKGYRWSYHATAARDDISFGDWMQTYQHEAFSRHLNWYREFGRLAH